MAMPPNPFATPAKPPGNPWAMPVAPAAVMVPPGAVFDATSGEVFQHADGTTYTQDELITEWRQAKDALTAAQAAEMKLRLMIVSGISDPTRDKGDQTIDIGFGWKMKITKVMNHKLKSFDKNVSHHAAVEDALSLMAPEATEGLVKWTPELYTSVYATLSAEQKAIIDTVLEIKPGAPTVELVAPKGAA